MGNQDRQNVGFCDGLAAVTHTMGRKAWERYHGISETELLEMTQAILREAE